MLVPTLTKSISVMPFHLIKYTIVPVLLKSKMNHISISYKIDTIFQDIPSPLLALKLYFFDF